MPEVLDNFQQTKLRALNSCVLSTHTATEAADSPLVLLWPDPGKEEARRERHVLQAANEHSLRTTALPPFDGPPIVSQRKRSYFVLTLQPSYSTWQSELAGVLHSQGEKHTDEENQDIAQEEPGQTETKLQNAVLV